MNQNSQKIKKESKSTEEKTTSRKKTDEVVTERKRRMLELLDNPEGFPIEGENSLCTLLSNNEKPLTKRTLQGYVKELNEKGYCIEKLKGVKNRWIRIKEKESFQAVAENGSGQETGSPDLSKNREKNDAEDAVYLFFLLTAFQGKNVTSAEFLRFLCGKTQGSKKYVRYQKILNRMKEKKLIKYDGTCISVCEEGRRLVVVNQADFVQETNPYAPIQKVIDSAEAVLEELQDYEDAENKPLTSAKEKYERAIVGEETGMQFGYVRRDTVNSEAENAKLIYDKLNGTDYKTKAIAVTYRTGSGKEQSNEICTGLLHFSKNKDTLYLLGRNIRNQKIVNIKVSEIQAATRLEVQNSEYDSDEMNQIYREMFDSTYEDGLHEVKVLVRKHAQVQDKFRQLAKIRTDANIEELESGEVIYTDKLRGLADFAAYLRQFGRSCVVQAPESLKKSVINSANRVLERYGAGEEEQA